MDEASVFGRGLAFPPRIAENGRWEWSQGPQNIRESLEIILLTQLGERVRLPEFGAGLRAYLFEPNIASTHRLMQEQIIQALNRWEPRVRLESVTLRSDPDDAHTAVAVIEYRLVADGSSGRISIGIQLDQ